MEAVQIIKEFWTISKGYFKLSFGQKISENVDREFRDIKP